MFDFSSLGFSVSMPMGYRAPSTAASKKLTIFVFFTYILEWTINLLHKDNRKRYHPRIVLMAEGHVKCKIKRGSHGGEEMQDNDNDKIRVNPLSRANAIFRTTRTLSYSNFFNLSSILSSLVFFIIPSCELLSV